MPALDHDLACLARVNLFNGLAEQQDLCADEPVPHCSRFSFRLFDGFCYEDRDDSIGLVLVLLIGRVCFYRDIPESVSLG